MSHSSVSQTKMPKRDDDAVAEFYVILYDDTIRNVLDLLYNRKNELYKFLK